MRTTVILQKLGMAQQKFEEFYREHCLTENPNSGEGFSRAISVLWERARLKARPPFSRCVLVPRLETNFNSRRIDMTKIKATLRFNRLPDADLLQHLNTVYQRMNGNPVFQIHMRGRIKGDVDPEFARALQKGRVYKLSSPVLSFIWVVILFPAM